MKDSRPSFILFFPDQWRGDCLGSLGHPVVETPNLDAIAGRGVTFTSAYSACPSCIATRASLATGKTPSNCGRMGYRGHVPWRYEHTLMHTLRDAGYQTMNVGKTHFHPERLALGFEENRLYSAVSCELVPGFKSDYHRWLDRETAGRVQDSTAENSSNSWLARPWPHEERLHPNSWTAENAIELLDRRDPTRPFFLQVGFHRPHPPFDPPQRWFDRFADKPLPPVPVGDWAGEQSPTADIETSAGRLDELAFAHSRRAYYAQLAHLDDQIGRVLWWLRLNGLDPWIIFMSDHGEMLGDHHRFRKSIALEGSAKVPMIVRPPAAFDGPRGVRCEAPIAHMDIMPTLLDASGVEPADALDGASIVPLLKNAEAPWREYVHGEHNRPKDGVQFVTDGREKFIWNSLSGRELFFDLDADPRELRDLSADPAFAGRLELWRGRLVETLAARPEDGLVENGRLKPGNMAPAVRPELLAD